VYCLTLTPNPNLTSTQSPTQIPNSTFNLYQVVRPHTAKYMHCSTPTLTLTLTLALTRCPPHTAVCSVLSSAPPHSTAAHLHSTVLPTFFVSQIIRGSGSGRGRGRGRGRVQRQRQNTSVAVEGAKPSALPVCQCSGRLGRRPALISSSGLRVRLR
jgi:hypothetical protein